jgi:hypothetical protein
MMLEVLDNKATDRRFRLFGCACVRRMLSQLSDGRSRRAVEESERWAEGLLTGEELAAIRKGAAEAAKEARGRLRAARAAPSRAQDEVRELKRTSNLADIPHMLLEWIEWPELSPPDNQGRSEASSAEAAENLVYAISWVETGQFEETPSLCRVVREVFGNPFRPITIDPLWLAWNGGTVFHLAQGIYDNQAFDRLPILTDALEEAGCQDADILGHCRQPGPHVLGCWVVDLLLGKS